eukprot:IDg19600t1
MTAMAKTPLKLRARSTTNTTIDDTDEHPAAEIEWRENDGQSSFDGVDRLFATRYHKHIYLLETVAGELRLRFETVRQKYHKTAHCKLVALPRFSDCEVHHSVEAALRSGVYTECVVHCGDGVDKIEK